MGRRSMADTARRNGLRILAALVGLAFLAGCGSSASAPAPSANSAPRAAPQWKFVHFYLKGGIWDGYGCDDFGSNGNCYSPTDYSRGPTVSTVDDRGAGSARWLAPGDSKLYFGLFHNDDYVSGWMPGGKSNRWCVTSGHLASLFGDDNVVSGCDPSKQPSPQKAESSQGAPLY